jgi:calmodulin-lysine N-methyltransferase
MQCLLVYIYIYIYIYICVCMCMCACVYLRKQEFNGEASYEVILCADCLFFDEARLDLVDTINGWLADDGVALVMAPRRGTTFREFAEAAVQRGFIARQIESYDTEVWSRHLDLLTTNPDYCPDIHFPVLLELTKQKKIPPG